MRLSESPRKLAEFVTECWVVTRETLAAAAEDNIVRMAAALAFYTLFSLAPALLIGLWIAGAFIGSTNAKTELVIKLKEIVTPDVAEYVYTVIDTFWGQLSDRKLPLVGVAGAAIAATAAFAELQSSLNTIWGVRHTQHSSIVNILYTRMLSFVFVVGIGILLLVSVLTSTVLASINEMFSHVFPIPDHLLGVLNLIISVAMIPTLLALSYKLIPDVSITWKDVWLAAVLASVFFLVGKWVFGMYLRHSTTLSVYGAAGSLAILLVWVYYSAQVFFIGAELTKIWARRYGSCAPDAVIPAETEPAAPSQSTESGEG